MGHPSSSMRGHLGTTGRDKLANHARREVFVWPREDSVRVSFCFLDMELDEGFPLKLPLSMGPITWHASNRLHLCPGTSYFPRGCQVAFQGHGYMCYSFCKQGRALMLSSSNPST